MAFRAVQPNAENAFPIFEEVDLNIRIAILAAIIIAAQILKLSISRSRTRRGYAGSSALLAALAES
jgi:hypothetical protein